VLWRIERGELDGIQPKVVVLMIGTNNIDRKPVEIAKGVTKVVTEVRRKLPATRILLLGIFPRGADPKDKTSQMFRFKIRAVNEALARLNDNAHVYYLDIGAKFLDAQSVIPADLMPDGLHPTEKGYRIWADAMQPLFDRLIQ
jgi:beta-glucosidase